MTESSEKELDDRLARLRASTERLTPRPGLAERLTARALAPRPRGVLLALPFARAGVIAAALAAAASLALAINIDSSLDDQMFQTFGDTELP